MLYISGAAASNPLLKMATEAPKVRTLCSKWQRECQKYELFATNGSWSAQSTNPVLKMAAGVPKVRTLCLGEGGKGGGGVWGAKGAPQQA